MLHWWQISYWRNYSALVCQRERLALLLWPYLSKQERSEDDAAALWLLSRMVRTIESGRADFHEDETAQQLWDRAKADSGIQSAAADLQGVRQHLTGFG